MSPELKKLKARHLSPRQALRAIGNKPSKKPGDAKANIDARTAFLKWLAEEVTLEADDKASEIIEMVNGVLLYFNTLADEGNEDDIEGLDELRDARANYRGPGIVR
jgi:hypothetical protein